MKHLKIIMFALFTGVICFSFSLLLSCSKSGSPQGIYPSVLMWSYNLIQLYAIPFHSIPILCMGQTSITICSSISMRTESALHKASLRCSSIYVFCFNISEYSSYMSFRAVNSNQSKHSTSLTCSSCLL